jgi:hypothetical protein
MSVLARYPQVAAGLPDHADEVRLWAARIVEAENTPTVVPVLPPEAPAWERNYWARRMVCRSCGALFRRGSGNKGDLCGKCATEHLKYEDGLR